MALLHTYADWDWDAAEAEYVRALELDPGYVWGHLLYGMTLGAQGRLEEAVWEYERAHDLDPLTFDPAGIDRGRLYEWSGQPEQAVAHWQETIEVAPAYYAPHLHLGDYYCRMGRPEDGIPLIERANELNQEEPWTRAALAYCLGISGREEEARAVLEELIELSSQQYVSPVGLALAHLGLGEVEEAFAHIERAFEIRAVRLAQHIVLDPRFEPLRSHAGMGRILRGMGLSLSPL